MNHDKTFYTANRQEWREWLQQNYLSETEIWFVFPTKDANEPSLSYNDAVEEALCFGWIDSTTGHIDDKHGIRRFTPRKKGSPYSRPNIERLIWLERNNLVIPQVRSEVLPIITKQYEFPTDIIQAIRSDEKAWKNYCNFAEPYKRIRIAYIDAARHRPDEFAKRLANFVEKTRQNKIIVGFGGIEKYYK